MIVNPIKEHSPIPTSDFPEELLFKEYRDGWCLNPNAVPFDRKYFFRWTNTDSSGGYVASFIIGAQNVCLGNSTKPLVITPKIDNIDFLRMFSLCFHQGFEAKAFSKIYSIDFTQKPIETTAFQSVLSPLIVVHFLTLIDGIVRKGLRKDYVPQEENLKKIKGRVDFIKNDRKNTLMRRFDRVYCHFQEYSANTPENRLLKKALVFAQKLLHSQTIAESIKGLEQKTNQYLAAFADVDEDIELWQINQIKQHKLYKEYGEALRLAKTLLKRYDYNLSKVGTYETSTPAFWIDMSLLFELYVNAMLKTKYHKDIDYHVSTHGNELDFVKYDEHLILDTKYILKWNESIVHDNIRQLSGYARNKTIRRKLYGFDNEQDIIPCVILHPSANGIAEFSQTEILKENCCQEIKEYLRFYKLGIHLPTNNK